MITIYILVIAATTSLGLTFIIKDFLTPNRTGFWGYMLFTFTFFVHDALLVFMGDMISATVKCIEYIVFYIISYLIVRYCFSGNSVRNFIWIYGANFIYQAMASIFYLLFIGLRFNFNYEKFEEITSMPLGENYVMLFATMVLGVAIAKALMKMLLKRDNRIVQIAVGVMAFAGILAGAINSAVSLYIVFPILCLALLVGMLHQDKMIKQIEKQEVYYSELENRQRIKNEELEKIRHDLANHISVINDMGSIDYAKEVLYVIDGELKSGVPIIDCLLDEKERNCKAKGIHLQEQLTDVSGSTVSNFDWISLLANLLDNAMEACERAGNEKEIGLELRRNGVYIIIELNNRKCAEEKPVENKFATVKQKKQGHGYGTKIIKDIVKKYDGRLQYEDLGDRMNIHIVMRAW